MTIWVGVGVYLLVHALGLWLLRASGTWPALFGSGAGLDRVSPRAPDPLRAAPTGWIENHTFWDLTADDTPDADDFWGAREAL